MARRRKGQDIDGLVLVDKPLGGSSNHVLQRVRRSFDARKAGHTGSLDPLATGLLPVCLGEATKLSSYLLSADKTYRVTAQVGARTATGDREGDIVERSATPAPDAVEFERLVDKFRGPQSQIPPMYSALKRDGKPLYELARAGQTVERAPRAFHVARLELLECGPEYFTLEAHVSGGTYIRTLVEDIAAAFGGCAHVATLRRIGVGHLGAEWPMVALADIEAADEQTRLGWLHPVSSLLTEWPQVMLDSDQALRIGQGQRVAAPPQTDRQIQGSDGGLLRLNGPDGLMLGLGTINAAGELAAKRLFARPQR